MLITHMTPHKEGLTPIHFFFHSRFAAYLNFTILDNYNAAGSSGVAYSEENVACLC